MQSLDYSAFMKKAGAYLELKIDLSDLIEVRQLGDMLGSLADQYDDFVKSHFNDQSHEARFYVQEVSRGSIIIEFVAATIGMMDQTIILKQFFDLTKTRVGLYLAGTGEPKASPARRQQIADMVRAVATSDSGTLSLAYKEKDADGSEAVLVIDKTEAREVLSTALDEKLMALEAVSQPEHNQRRRVMMYFFQTNRKTHSSGKRTGEKVVIPAIHKKPKALIYESQAAEDRVKHEILEEEDNIYKKAFLVDVDIESLNDRITAYRLMSVHEVLDIEDDDGPRLLQ